MVALARIGFGESPISSAKVNAVIDTLTGAANTPVNLTGVNDPINYTLAIRNQDAAGKGLVVYAADGATVLLQVQNSGVRASAAGGAALSIVTTDDAQTLTNKTLTAPVIGAGGLTVTGNILVHGSTNDSSTYGLQVTNAAISQNILLARNDGQVSLGYGGIFVVGPTNVVLNTGDLLTPPGSTSATSGFVYIPRAAGPPVGTPTNHAAGSAPLYFDTTNHKLWVWDDSGASWKGVVVA